jgi:hypothetical protein
MIVPDGRGRVKREGLFEAWQGGANLIYIYTHYIVQEVSWTRFITN